MDTRLRIVSVISIVSLLLLGLAWLLSNKIAQIQPETARVSPPMVVDL